MTWKNYCRLGALFCYGAAIVVLTAVFGEVIDALWTRTFSIRTATHALSMVSTVLALVYVGLGYEADDMDKFAKRVTLLVLLGGISMFLYQMLAVSQEVIH